MRVDSRPIKTKKSIKQALLVLLKEKDISSITISELANCANVSRKTFYLHYKDISQILEDIKNDLQNLFDDSVMKDKRVGFRVRTLNFINNIVQRVNEEEDYYALMASSDYAKIIFNPIEDRLKEEFLYALDTETNLKQDVKECLIDFMIGGIVNSVLKWANNPDGISPAEQSRILFEIINNNVACYLNNNFNGYWLNICFWKFS